MIIIFNSFDTPVKSYFDEESTFYFIFKICKNLFETQQSNVRRRLLQTQVCKN